MYIFWSTFSLKRYVGMLFNLTKYGLGYTLGDFFVKASGHAGRNVIAQSTQLLVISQILYNKT
jgi:hypothetical protein